MRRPMMMAPPAPPGPPPPPVAAGAAAGERPARRGRRSKKEPAGPPPLVDVGRAMLDELRAATAAASRSSHLLPPLVRLANASGPFSGAQPAGPWSGSTVDAICVGSLVYISGRAKKANASQTGGAAKPKGWFGLG